MSGSTTELALKTAVDADDTADYLTLSLADSLRTLDALFNNVSGHNHGSAHQGGPIASIPVGSIPDGSITSAKIADGTISGADIAAGTITSGNIADGTILNQDLAIGQISGDRLQNGTITTTQIADGTIATGDLADGSVTTPKIAANSAQQLLGQYAATPAFSTSSTGTWIATPISLTVTTTGGLLRVTVNTSMSHSAVGGAWTLGIGSDGPPGAALLIAMSAITNQLVPITPVIYSAVAAGTHTITLYVNLSTAGTLTLSNAITHTMYIVEQKR